ncbi:hypothetical protein DVS77_06700 [Mycolicibacterium moriokaense]|nr:hypothetical protein DVS77_06700 [Mycolicibacterium moriokaense]
MTVSITDRPFNAAEAIQPHTVSALLRELGMSHACAEKQKAALGTWMMIHEAQPPLRISLLRNGYGLLLKEIDGRRARPGSLA